MRLPNPDMAIVDEAKVREYLLSTTHPVGRFKAVFFLRLGFTQDDWTELRQALIRDHAHSEAQNAGSSAWGQKFRIDAGLAGPQGTIVQATSIWIVRTGESVARFVTAYPSSSP